MKLTSLAVATTILLSACGGGGGTTSSATAPAAPSGPTVALFNPVNLAQAIGVSQSELANNDINIDIMAIGDVNKDGYDDVLVGLMRTDLKGDSIAETIKPVLLVFNPTSFQFEVSAAFADAVPKHVWPRAAVIADFNGDGTNDIFIGDHGTDGWAVGCGYQNSLILNQGNRFVNQSASLPQVADYTHGVIVADFNNDKVNDILSLNSPYLDLSKPADPACKLGALPQRNRSYVIAGGNYAEIPLSFSAQDLADPAGPPVNISETNTRFGFTGASADLNKDGFPDLVIGEYSELTIAESTGPGTFKTGIRIPAPQKYVEFLKNPANCGQMRSDVCEINYSSIAFHDIDGDGSVEIIASLTSFWRGQYFQVLKKKDGQWADVTETVFTEQTNAKSPHGSWCYRLSFVDLNRDGVKDLVCGNYDSQQTKVFWINANGKFIPWSENPAKGKWFYSAVTLGKDSYVLGFGKTGSRTGNIGVTIEGWKN